MAKSRQEDSSIATPERSQLPQGDAMGADTLPSDPKSDKKRNRNGNTKAKHAQAEDDDEDMSDSSSERDLINVDFEFFDPQEHDFHGIKQLLRQLFDADSVLLDLSALTDLILEQKLVGSTVKVDGREGDPYSFLSVVNWQLHKSKPCVQSLASYLLDRSAGTPLEPRLQTFLSTDYLENTAIVLSERLVNMPPEISPPSYKMLLEEIEYAVEDNEPYKFTHYLLISKVYAEIESKLDMDAEDRPSKRHKLAAKKKSKKSSSSKQTFNFHPEDDFFVSRATMNSGDNNNGGAHAVYKFKHEPPEGAADAKRAFQDFGILPKGRMILLTREGFETAVETMQPSA
ncbi:hypothetical protein ABW20_dc0104646 [Dactylellina cionopaga]|nr:hypothetical protein ABW20_dc0104646 [Dactylellina cionopaga]